MNRLNPMLLTLVLACTFTLQACREKPTVTEEIPLVMVAQPLADVMQVQSYAGNIQAQQQSPLAFRVAGQVTQRLVDVGDRVVAGQVLAKLDVKDAQLQLNSAQAQLDNAKTAAALAATELSRYKQLLPSNAVSRSQFDAVQNQYDAAQAQLKQAKANYAVNANLTQYNQLTANQAGVITQRHIEVGQVVAAGQMAYQLAASGEREVLIAVPEQIVGQLRLKQAATVTLWSQPNTRLQGFIREISPATNVNKTFDVKVALPNAQQLQLGQSARVYFTNSSAGGVNVPLSSVSADGNQAFVWVVKPDYRIRKVSVTLGVYGRDSVPVLSGLSTQDWVVIGGVHLLRDQQTIKPINRNNQPVNVKAGG